METISIIIVGTIITYVVQISKKWGISSKVALAFFSVFLGGLYYLFDQFLDPMIKTNVINFVLGSMGFAVIIYEYFIKLSKDKK